MVDLDALDAELQTAEFHIVRFRNSLLVFDPRRGHEQDAARVTSDGQVNVDQSDHPALSIIRKHVEGA